MHSPIDPVLEELRNRFADAVQRNTSEGLLFSGGLDSALVAAFSRDCTAISVGLDLYSEDMFYAKAVEKALKINLEPVTVSVEEALAVIPDVIGTLGSFDPALPNDVAVFIGLRHARDMNIKNVMTGDGSDEIFAGYGFMQEMEDLDYYLSRMYRSMQFSSNRIGRRLGLRITQPFLDEEFFAFGKALDTDCKIRKENGAVWGKWILRKAFEDTLPKEILWQSKRPLEYGSGMIRLRGIITGMVTDEDFERGKREYTVKFWNKEHFYYYRIYRDVVGEIPEPREGEKACACCGAGIPRGAFHCRICGDVTEWKNEKK